MLMSAYGILGPALRAPVRTRTALSGASAQVDILSKTTRVKVRSSKNKLKNGI